MDTHLNQETDSHDAIPQDRLEVSSIPQPSENDISSPDDKLGSSGPLLTLFKSSIGPIFTQVTNTLYGLVNTIWLGKAVAFKSMSAFALTSVYDSLGLMFGAFFAGCASSKITQLFREKKHALASQVFSDYLRMSIIMGIVIPSVMIPCSKIFMRWMGAAEDVVTLGYDFLIPSLAGSVFSIIYQVLIGCLQGEGRVFISCLMQFLSFLLNTAAFNPLFLIYLKSGIRGCAISTILSQAIPALCLFIPYYMGKFTVKPKCNELCQKFSKESISSLTAGLPAIINSLLSMAPGFFFQYFLSITSTARNTTLAVYNSYFRINAVEFSLFGAFSAGFGPAASLAYKSGNNKRVYALFGHLVWILTAISGVLLAVLYILPKEFGSIFATDKDFLGGFKACVLPYWTTTVVSSWPYALLAALSALGQDSFATILSYLKGLVIFPAFLFVFYYYNQTITLNILYSIFTTDVISFVVICPFAVLALYQLKGVGATGQKLLNTTQSKKLTKEEHDSMIENDIGSNEMKEFQEDTNEVL